MTRHAGRLMVVAVLVAVWVGAPAQGAGEPGKALVAVGGLSKAGLEALLAAGHEPVGHGPDGLEVVIGQAELAAIKKTGARVRTLIPDLDRYVRERLESQTAEAAYLTYETMSAELQRLVAAYPAIARLESIGRSHEGRELWAVKVSDHPDRDEPEPAVLLAGAHHAREWTTVEVPMAVLRTLLAGYGTDPRLTRLVDEREIWIVPMVNPDGVTWSQTQYKYWRKNRRPLPNKVFGVDLNRNYGYHWGETGGNYPSGDTYPGPAAFSEPETLAIKTLAARERFQASICYHSYSELILYPFAYAAGVPNPDEPVFIELGRAMAAFNRYRVQNCTELYPAAGISDDWLYGIDRTLAFTFEMGRQFIPPVSEIASQCAINVPASLELLDRCAAAAVNTPSGDPGLPGRLSLSDGLAALAMGQRLRERFSGPAREVIAGRLQATARRVAQLAAEAWLAGDATVLAQVRANPVGPGLLPMIRSRVVFEACHRADRGADLIASFDRQSGRRD